VPEAPEAPAKSPERPEPRSSEPRFRPDLEGFRGIAILLVLLCHARLPGAEAGFIGVDVFFVLSGFLITGLLMTEHRRTGRVRLGPFWGRRARRLLPALLLVLVTVAVVSRTLLPEAELGQLRWDALAALGYVANWRMIYRGGDYFAATAPPSPLQHTWSLGIEEQFYILWPLLVLLVLRTGRSRPVLLIICAAGTVVSAVVCALVYHPQGDPGRAYYGTDARAGALLLGCLVAVALHNRSVHPGRWLPAGAAVCTAGLVAAWMFARGTDTWLYRGGLTALAAAVAVVLAYLVLTPTGWGARMLSVAPLAWLGRVSYGVYLWHWPLFQWLTAERTGLTGAGLVAARMAAALGAATLSFYLVESPLRRALTVRRQIRRVLTWRAVVPITAVCLGGTALIVLGATAVPVRPASAALSTTDAPLAGTDPRAASAAPSVGSAPATRPGTGPMARPGRRPGALPRVTILGDSVAWTIGAYLPAHPQVAVANRAVQGCGIARLPDIRYIGAPHTNYPGCDQWDQSWRRSIAGDDPDVSMILLNRWELMDRKLDGRYQHVGEPDFDAYLTKELNLAIDIGAGSGARVVLLTAAYTHRAERPDGGLWPEDTPERVNAWNQLLQGVAKAHPARPAILDLNHLVCPNATFTWNVNGLKIRSDGLHFPPAGVQKVIAPWLLPQLVQTATTP
jgi:peptidoglycan/LPS O-acetylase OafA/YrhL